ncbi:MAG: DUF6067 family protein [Armatimonadota bacterium]|nr:DUF6067 family protein [Armatimonadota bacterium]
MRASLRIWHLVAGLATLGIWGCLVVAQEAPTGSLVPNAGIEEGVGEEPAEWRFYSWQDSEGWWEAQRAHSGSRSLGISGLNGGWSVTVPVQAGALYSLSLRYRAEGGPGRVVPFVRRPIGDGEMATLLYRPTAAIPHDQQGQFVDGRWIGGADEEGWVAADFGEFTVPEGVEAVSLLVKLRADQPGVSLLLDDVVIRPLERPELEDTARMLRRFPGGALWTDNENRKILPDRPLPEGEPLDAISVSAARGEYEAFQLAVTPTTSARNVAFTWTDLSGPEVLPADLIFCRRIETITIERPMGPYGHRGLTPDPLTDRLPVDIPEGVNQGFWFTLHVPPGQPAGEYEGQLTLIAGDDQVTTVPLRLHVHDFAIPPRPSLDVHSHLRSRLVLEREAGDPEYALARYYADIYAHRSRCSPGVIPRVQVRGETATVDAEEYIDHLLFMHEELGARRFTVPSLWIGHRGEHVMPADAQWQGIPIFADKELTELNPAFELPFRDYMTTLVVALKDAGVFLEPTVHFIDEPRLDDERTRNGIRTLSELLLDIEPELRIAHTVSAPHPELLDVTHVWVLHTDAWERSLAQIQAAREDGDAILVYNNGVNYPSHPPIRVRLWPWLLRKYAVDGTYSWWGTVCWRGPVEDPWTAGEGSSGVLLYPPRSEEEAGPIDSIRWELFREGLEDYEYMALAERLATELEEAGDAEAAKAGRQAVQEALALVERWPTVRGANDQPYTLDVTAVDAAREALAEAIERMRDALQQ